MAWFYEKPLEPNENKIKSFGEQKNIEISHHLI